MSYIYSQINRLEESCSYMYTPFQGLAFLKSYHASRAAVLRRYAASNHTGAELDHFLGVKAGAFLGKFFGTISAEVVEDFRAFSGDAPAKISNSDSTNCAKLKELSEKLTGFTTAEPVATEKLLLSLIAAQLLSAQDANVKIWLDRMVQRFEVTKKVYEIYPQGFRKGEGSYKSIRLYWLLALALCLFYVRSRSVKYLSTLLKVCDLLCSLPEDVLQNQVPALGMSVVLTAESTGVKLLAEKKGVLHGFK